MQAPPRLTEEQALKYVPCTRDKLKALRQKRQVRYFRIGHRSVVYDRESIDDYLDRVEVTGRTN